MSVYNFLTFGGWGNISEFNSRLTNFTNTSSTIATVSGRKVLSLVSDTSSLINTSPTTYSTFVVGMDWESVTENRLLIRFIDVNGITLDVALSTIPALIISYNPSGTDNDISATVELPIRGLTRQFYEFEWTPSNFKVYANNKLLYTKAWTGVNGRFQLIGTVNYGLTPSLRGYLTSMYVASTRLGMCPTLTATLATPTSDTSVSVTGAASRELAFTSFDNDTSFVTYTQGSNQETTLPLTATLPSGSTIHAINITTSARGDGGVATGSIRVETPDGNTEVGDINLTLDYAPTNVTLSVDPATANPFDVADLNAGDITVSIMEG